MNRREANTLDRYLTEPTEKLYKEPYEDDPVDTTDCFGNEIADEDGVFELTFAMKCLYTGQPVLTCKKIATQDTIVDLIEELGEENVYLIEYVSSGKRYKEGLLNG